MQQFSFTAPALSIVFATLENEIAHPVHIERPARSRAKVVELDDEENFVRAEAICGVKRCLEDGPSLLYGRGDPPVPKVKEVGSKKRKDSSSLISIGKAKRRTATRSGGGKEDGVQRIKTK